MYSQVHKYLVSDTFFIILPEMNQLLINIVADIFVSWSCFAV